MAPGPSSRARGGRMLGSALPALASHSSVSWTWHRRQCGGFSVVTVAPRNIVGQGPRHHCPAALHPHTLHSGHHAAMRKALQPHVIAMHRQGMLPWAAATRLPAGPAGRTSPPSAAAAPPQTRPARSRGTARRWPRCWEPMAPPSALAAWPVALGGHHGIHPTNTRVPPCISM